MTDEPKPPPRDPGDPQKVDGAPVDEPPPFEPDLELIGYWEQAQKGAPEQR